MQKFDFTKRGVEEFIEKLEQLPIETEELTVSINDMQTVVPYNADTLNAFILLLKDLYITTESGDATLGNTLEVIEDIDAKFEALSYGVETIFTEHYSPDTDVTFVMKETWDDDDVQETEVIAFYHGRPDPKITEMYAKNPEGGLKAIYG